MVVSMLLGVLSIIASPFFFVAFPAAAMSIIFAVLSKGNELKMDIMPKAGVITSVFGMVCSLLITGLVILLILTSSAYRERLNETSMSMYGITMDEAFKQSYGFSLEDASQRFSELLEGK